MCSKCAGIQCPSPYGLHQLALAFSVAEREVRTIPRGLEGHGPVSQTFRKTPRLIIITFYEHLTESVSHSDTAPRLSACHVDALCWLSLVRLVAATHAVITRRVGQAMERDKVNCDLSCWSGGEGGAGCAEMHRSSVDSPGLLKEFESEGRKS